MLRSVVYKDNNIEVDLPLAKLAEAARDPGSFLWIDIQGITEDEADFLVLTFRFHPLAIEDCMGDYVQTKREDYDDHMFISFDAIAYVAEEREFKAINLNCFLAKSYIITTAPSGVNEIDAIFKNPKQVSRMLSNGTDHVLYSVMDKIVDTYFLCLRYIEDMVVDIETRITADEIEGIQDTIFSARKHMLFLRRHLSPQSDILAYFNTVDNPYTHKKTRVYFRDVLDHASRVLDVLTQNREVLNWAMDTYRSEILIKTNDIMKVLSIIAAIMLPLTLITGVYGMNFAVLPGSGREYGFWAVMVFMLLLAIAMLYYFKRKKWI